MKLSSFKNLLENTEMVHFELEDGRRVPAHFHVTEVGIISKHFIDCGGTLRKEEKVNFQLWSAEDINHRLMAPKLLQIIKLSEEKLQLGDHEIEVEYQLDTIGKFGLDFDGKRFILTQKQTACLASDQCGVPTQKTKLNLIELVPSNSCEPGSGCC